MVTGTFVVQYQNTYPILPSTADGPEINPILLSEIYFWLLVTTVPKASGTLKEYTIINHVLLLTMLTFLVPRHDVLNNKISTNPGGSMSPKLLHSHPCRRWEVLSYSADGSLLVDDLYAYFCETATIMSQ